LKIDKIEKFHGAEIDKISFVISANFLKFVLEI